MPEIILPGLRHTGGGPTEADRKLLREARQSEKILLWSHRGTAEECENSWQDFLLADVTDWIIYQ